MVNASAARILDEFTGQVCSHVQSNVGSMVSLDFGTSDPPDWGLFVHFGEWFLRLRGEPLTYWDAPREALVEAIAVVLGRRVLGVDFDDVSGDAEFRFSDELLLTIRPCTYDSEEPWWLLCRSGQVVLQAQPGPTFAT